MHPLLAGGGADAVDGRAVGDEVGQLAVHDEQLVDAETALEAGAGADLTVRPGARSEEWPLRGAEAEALALAVFRRSFPPAPRAEPAHQPLGEGAVETGSD